MIENKYGDFETQPNSTNRKWKINSISATEQKA